MGLMPQDLARLGPAARKQILEKMGMTAAKGRKYHNQPDTRGKVKFDSKKEARRYDELMLLLQAGEIRNLRLQAQYTLQEGYTTPEGERVQAIRYVADFTYEKKKLIWAKSVDGEESWYWETVVEDVKSRATRTETYKIKAKLLKERFGLTITEV